MVRFGLGAAIIMVNWATEPVFTEIHPPKSEQLPTGKILDEAGIQYSCVHYEPIAVAIKGISGTGTIAGLSKSLVDRLSGNLALIKSGLWNEKHNVVDNPKGRIHVFTPDTNNYGWPYNISTSATDFTVSGNNLQFPVAASNFNAQLSYPVTSSLQQGTQRQYCWYFTGLPASTNCLTFIISEVYEFIPDIGSVGILKLEENLAYEYHKHLTQDVVQARKQTGWKSVKNTIS